MLSEKDAWAYTDPGSGVLIWQGLLAFLFGLMFYARRITAWLRRRRSGREGAGGCDGDGGARE
jgi:hypothetical protein